MIRFALGVAVGVALVWSGIADKALIAGKGLLKGKCAGCG